MNGTYISTATVKFLADAGALVVPLNYRLSVPSLQKVLAQLNGVYIPGDRVDNLNNTKYLDTVSQIYDWAQTQNVKSAQHFPVVATSYGFLAVLQTLAVLSQSIVEVPLQERYVSLQINLRLNTEDTYTYDAYSLAEAETLLDNIVFFTELSFNIKLNMFLKEKALSKLFVPIATFNKEYTNQGDEFVAIMEGAFFPFYGFAFNIEKITHTFDFTQAALVDTSRDAMLEAQRIGNLIVDEARLNSNYFAKAIDEKNLLIQNFDFTIVEQDFTDDNSDETQIIELYLFD